jgi:organic hydroperoxide reductase OsmC/OhrA
MLGHHHYSVDVAWQGNLGTGTSGYRDYKREVEVRSLADDPIRGSADKPFRGDPTRWNPEQLLLAALAQCHLLSYLHVAVTLGVVVTDYSDSATGTMIEDGRSGGAFTEVVLRPIVTVASEDMVEAATAAHKTANELCFIASSVAFPVRHEPVIRVAGSPIPADADADTDATASATDS